MNQERTSEITTESEPILKAQYVTLKITYDAAEVWYKPPGDWDYAELLDVPDRDYVRVVSVVDAEEST